MHALHELCALGLVTLTTRRRNVDFCDRRLRVRGGKDVVTPMAVGAYSRGDIALREGLGVNTFSI